MVCFVAARTMGRLSEHVGRLRGRGKLTLRAPETLPAAMTWGDRAVVATVSLGVGLFPMAPATLASAVVAAAAFLLRDRLSWETVLAAVAVVTILGVSLGRAAERVFRREDPRPFILDEVAGQLLVFVFHPATGVNCALGFIFFRVFDVLKPPPGERLEALGGGWGIMLDDLLAGLYAAGVLYLLRAVLPA
jgi:phosphatidylglycerophosphatase A